jgi:hypothetical protein
VKCESTRYESQWWMVWLPFPKLIDIGFLGAKTRSLRPLNYSHLYSRICKIKANDRANAANVEKVELDLRYCGSLKRESQHGALKSSMRLQESWFALSLLLQTSFAPSLSYFGSVLSTNMHLQEINPEREEVLRGRFHAGSLLSITSELCLTRWVYIPS